jgi:hypothetical protein
MARKTRKATKNIFLRGSIWWIRYSANGRQIRESSDSTVFDDADRLLKKLVTGKFAGLAPERIKIEELLADVEQDYRDNARASLPQLLSRLKRLKPAFGSIRAADFSSDHVKRYRDQPGDRSTGARLELGSEVRSAEGVAAVLFSNVRGKQHPHGLFRRRRLPGAPQCVASIP